MLSQELSNLTRPLQLSSPRSRHILRICVVFSAKINKAVFNTQSLCSIKSSKILHGLIFLSCRQHKCTALFEHNGHSQQLITLRMHTGTWQYSCYRFERNMPPFSGSWMRPLQISKERPHTLTAFGCKLPWGDKSTQHRCHCEPNHKDRISLASGRTKILHRHINHLRCAVAKGGFSARSTLGQCNSDDNSTRKLLSASLIPLQFSVLVECLQANRSI